MKILISGASGFIGSHFHEQLPQLQIINFDLIEPKFDYESTFFKGDIRNKDEVELCLSKYKCDTILHLAAEHKDFGVSYEDFFKTNEFGTKTLCDAATKFGIKKFIFYSSVAVYGNNKTPSSEKINPNPLSPYGKSKSAGEKVLEQWATEDLERCVIIIRPAVVYGERNVANMFRLIEQIKEGHYFHIGKGENVKSIAYVKNLVEATIWLMDRMKPGVQVYNYADSKQLSSRHIASVISKALGRKEPITLPYWLVYTMGIPFDIAIKLTGKDLPISTNRLKKFCTETYHKADKIREAGFVPKYFNEEGLQNMVLWMNSKNFKNEAIFDV